MLDLADFAKQEQPTMPVSLTENIHLSRDFMLDDHSMFDFENKVVLGRTLNSLDNYLDSFKRFGLGQSHATLCLATQQNEEAVIFRLT